MDHREAHQRKLVVRLRRVEGQLRGVQAMMEKRADCEDIAQQLAAARKALDRTFYEMIACSLEQAAQEGGTPEDMQAATARMTRLLAKYG